MRQREAKSLNHSCILVIPRENHILVCMYLCVRVCACNWKSEDYLECCYWGFIHLVILKQGLLLISKLPNRYGWLVGKPQGSPGLRLQHTTVRLSWVGSGDRIPILMLTRQVLDHLSSPIKTPYLGVVLRKPIWCWRYTPLSEAMGSSSMCVHTYSPNYRTNLWKRKFRAVSRMAFLFVCLFVC